MKFLRAHFLKKALYLQNHYNCAFDDITNSYNFTTKNNALYRVAFVVDGMFSAVSNPNIPSVFQLIIDKVSDELEPYDQNFQELLKIL